MTKDDDLVKRLRAVDHLSVEDCFLQSPLYAYAADCIEALEAKLAKAVEAGKTMDDGCDCERCNKARATLAELEGDKP